MDKRELIRSGNLVEFTDGSVFLCIETNFGKFLITGNGKFDVNTDFDKDLNLHSLIGGKISEIYEINNASMMMSPIEDSKELKSFKFYKNMVDQNLILKNICIRKLNPKATNESI